jgi:type IV pilus assembly protein PilZ
MAKPGLLTLTIKDKSALYLAYMPFVMNGGLFIPTNSSYKLGDEVFMLLNLMGEDEKIPVAGKVIWLTPKGAQGKRTAGIGVQASPLMGAERPFVKRQICSDRQGPIMRKTDLAILVLEAGRPRPFPRE